MARAWRTSSPLRSHPIRQLYDTVAAGEVPTDADLERLGIPDKWWRALRQEAREIKELHDAGDHKNSREQAKDAGERLIALLGDEWGATPADNDPKALAALVEEF